MPSAKALTVGKLQLRHYIKSVIVMCNLFLLIRLACMLFFFLLRVDSFLWLILAESESFFLLLLEFEVHLTSVYCVVINAVSLVLTLIFVLHEQICPNLFPNHRYHLPSKVLFDLDPRPYDFGFRNSGKFTPSIAKKCKGKIEH